jgi:AraC family ethanolamine operon transcriptional activator
MIASSACSLSRSFEPSRGVVTLETNDFEELAAARAGWRLNYQQLGSGRFHGSLLEVRTSRLALTRLSRSPGILAQGSVPKGSIALAFSLQPQPALFYDGSALKADEVAIAWSDEEFDFRALGPSDIFIACISEEVAVRHAQALSKVPLKALAPDHRLAVPDVTLVSLAAPTFCSLLNTLVQQPQLLVGTRSGHYIETIVLDTLLGAVDMVCPRNSAATRTRIARRAEEYLRARLTEPLTVSELCEAVGTSERILQLAFLERFGMSPRQLLKALRLNGVRRELLESTSSTSVTSVALDWGFLHLGRFSVAYREMFGETAIATLRCALTTSGADRKPNVLPRRVA